MTPDIEKDDFFVCYHYGKRDPVTLRKADRLDIFQLPAEAVQLKVRLKGVFFHVTNELGEPLFQLRMFPEEFLCAFQEIVGSDNDVHLLRVLFLKRLQEFIR